MSALGSVFLGDVQRQRILSTSTPPSSPPPSVSPSAVSTFPDPLNLGPNKRDQTIPVHISPALSLDMRIRWLETLVFGTKPDGKLRPLENIHVSSVVRAVEDFQRRLEEIVESNESLKRFVEHYESNGHLLTPTFALSGTIPTTPPPYENMSPSELEAFLAEMEQDIKNAARDLNEIDILEKKGVTAPGKLVDYEILRPRLEHLLKAHEEDQQLAANLEKRIAALMDHYATHVDTLSELFVAWDDTLEGAEAEAAGIQRDLEERQRLGYE